MTYLCINRLLKYIRMIGLAEMLGLTLLFYYLFYRAYFDPTKAVILAIDLLHEANLEAITLAILLPIIIYGFINYWRDEYDR